MQLMISTKIEEMNLVLPTEIFPVWASCLRDGVASKLRNLSLSIIDRNVKTFKGKRWDKHSDITVVKMLQQREALGSTPQLEKLCIPSRILTAHEETQLRSLVKHVDFHL